MKKILTIISFCVLALSGWAQNLTVKGKLNGAKDGTVITLVPYSHDKEKHIAQATVKGGEFSISTTIDESYYVSVAAEGTFSMARMMVTPGDNITLSGDFSQGVYENGNAYTEIKSFKVEGSSMQATIDEMMAERKAAEAKRAAFERKYANINKEYYSAYSAKDSVKMKQLRETEEFKAMEAEDHAFFASLNQALDNAVKKYSDSFIAPLAMLMQTAYLTSENGVQYNQFSETAKNSFYGKRVHDEIWPAGQPGSKVQDFTLHTPDGKPVKLADIAKGKKYVYIDFWASWCGPCRRELPNVKKNYELYKDKGFEVLGISIDKREADWQKACKDEGLQWPSFRDGEVADLFKVKSVPTIYLVDAEGTIVAINEQIRGEKLGEKLAELFK